MQDYTFFRGISLVFRLLLGLAYAYQVLYLFVPCFLKTKAHKAVRRNRYAVLIAARNEEKVLPYLLDSLHAQSYPQSLLDIYVAADNCTDETARLAREKGARVFERFDRERIGKGYALDFLLSKIEESRGLAAYDAFLVFDADNLLEKDYVEQMNRSFCDGYPVLTGYRNSKNFGENWLTSAYALWFLHDSTHLNRSRMLLGNSCMVSGTGFLFSYKVLEACGGWKFFSLTEDLEFNVYCAVHGIKIGYCPDAVLYDEQPCSFSQSWRQRSRWIQGGIQVAAKYGKDLLLGIFRQNEGRFCCYELFSLSVWGYGIAALGLFLGVFESCLAKGLIPGLLFSLLGLYLSLFPVGLLTLCREWKRIHGSCREKIRAILGFPVFLFTFVPIAVYAMFSKFQWKPIEHRRAVDLKTVKGKIKSE